MYIWKNNSAMKKNLPLIALQLDHPDATFYRVGLHQNTVSGLFQAHDDNQPFEVGFSQFLESCYKCGVIADFADGCIYIPGDRTDRNARQWATDWLQENAGTKEFFRVLADAIWSEFALEMSAILAELQRATPAAIAERVFRGKDTALCDAVEKLAAIVRAANEYEADVKAANEPQPPTNHAELVSSLAVDALASGHKNVALVLHVLAGSMHVGLDPALAIIASDFNKRVLGPYTAAGLAAKHAAQN